MIINIVTIFPDFFTTPLGLSIPARAAAAGSVTFNVVDLRDHTHDRHRTVVRGRGVWQGLIGVDIETECGDQRVFGHGGGLRCCIALGDRLRHIGEGYGPAVLGLRFGDVGVGIAHG